MDSFFSFLARAQKPAARIGCLLLVAVVVGTCGYSYFFHYRTAPVAVTVATMRWRKTAQPTRRSIVEREGWERDIKRDCKTPTYSERTLSRNGEQETWVTCGVEAWVGDGQEEAIETTDGTEPAAPADPIKPSGDRGVRRGDNVHFELLDSAGRKYAYSRGGWEMDAAARRCVPGAQCVADITRAGEVKSLSSAAPAR